MTGPRRWSAAVPGPGGSSGERSAADGAQVVLPVGGLSRWFVRAAGSGERLVHAGGSPGERFAAVRARVTVPVSSLPPYSWGVR
ncbi:hypothetical protein [Amycolatopsis sp. lyj-23]|uniref:hypothetical protein n=1 Tax=Amycolatopsis sp. lyj-23 TaxID=2789283 RepID=UPI00397AF9F4